MVQTSGSSERNAFSRWIRTGKVPSALSPDGLELKFNPWHDPEDGRFTFAGAGRRYGAGGVDAAGGENGRTSSSTGSVSALGKRSNSQTAPPALAGVQPAGAPTGEDQKPVKHALLALQPKRIEGRRPGNEPSPLNEFVGGVGEGLYDVGKATVAGVHAALTTNPATTIRNAGREIAGMIDTAIAAEDTPARIPRPYPSLPCGKRRRQRLGARHRSRHRKGCWERCTGGSAGGGALQGCGIAPTPYREAAYNF